MRRGFGLALAAALACLCLSSAAAQAGDLEATSFASPGLEEDGSASTAAGGHPYGVFNSFTFNTKRNPRSSKVVPAENIKDLKFELPPGFVGNVANFPTCSQTQIDFSGGGSTACPVESQVGIARVRALLSGNQTFQVAIYNMEPPSGVAAQFAFVIVVAKIHIDFRVRSGSDYGVTATLHNLSNTAPIFANSVTIWGDPADPSHDFQRAGCANPNNHCEEEFPGAESTPLLSNPTSCTGPIFNTMQATTWQLPSETMFAAPDEAAGMTGCNEVDFAPAVEAKPTTNLADSPSGFDFHLQLPQNKDVDSPEVAHLRDSRVVLPPSLTVNPSSANGLDACSPSQIGFTGPSNEEQTLGYIPRETASFVVESGGHSTAPIASKATGAEVAQAIETLPGLAGNVSVGGSPGSWIVTFDGALAGTDAPQLSGTVIDNSVQSVDVTGEGGGYNLNFGGGSTGATFDASFSAGVEVLIASNRSRTLNVGELVVGPGVAPGSKITAFVFNSPNLPRISIPTTEAQTEAHLSTALLFDTSAETLEEALQAIPAIGEGNVFVTDAGASGSTRSFEVHFTGDLSGTEPALIDGFSALTGPGAGIDIAQVPNTPHPLTVGPIQKAGTPQFTPEASNCPDAAKVGTVRIDSPAVIDHPLEGSVYLATPHQNPFNSLLALYISVNDAKSGVVLKLPARLDSDPNTGQLTATVSEAPQLPFEDLRLEFFKGAAAPLKTGIACGKSEVLTDMTPWTAPQGAVKHPGDSFEISHGAGGGACVSSEAAAPNAPRFEAGTADPVAGAYSPFVLKLTRQDGTQQLKGIDTTLPKGLLAKLAGVPYCSDAALAAAANKSGKSEQGAPSCPAASRVGNVTVGAGAGPAPSYAGGNAYLAGPYKGAPLSLAVVTPAVAGPFDLGTVVVRNALYVDPESAQVHAVSDPFPSILQGIPLDLRSIALSIDKSKFIRNPTNCSPFAISGAAATLAGQSAPLSNRFQVGECSRLKFGPKLALSLKGGTSRGDHPALKAVLTAKDGEAGIARTSVALPHSEFLAQDHIKTICTRVQFAADACPKGSIYGKATATTPLLDKPLSGPVYLRSSNHQLPDLVVALHGQIDVDLAGRIDSIDGGIRTTFEAVPDAPVSKFVLSMQGGKKGLLENSRNLCTSTNRATVEMDGQNAKTADTQPALKSLCKKKGAKKRKHR